MPKDLAGALLRGAAALVLALSLVRCGGADDSPVAEDGAAIVGGRLDRTHPAVGELGLAPRVHDPDVAWICTATLVSPRRVLTAAHCVTSPSGRPVAARRLWFRVGGVTVQGAHLHVAEAFSPDALDGPWHDLAVLELKREVEEVTPMAVAANAPEPEQTATVIGFGVTHPTGAGTGDGSGVRRRATITIGDVTDEELVYAPEGHGACYGDSGGPIVRGPRGREVVIGVTSRGTSIDCTGLDVATRTDTGRAWILGE